MIPRLVDLSAISKVENSGNDVSDGKIFYGRMAWMSKQALDTICCLEHGAMLNVAINERGKIWRCPACNVGAFEEIR